MKFSKPLSEMRLLVLERRKQRVEKTKKDISTMLENQKKYLDKMPKDYLKDNAEKIKPEDFLKILRIKPPESVSKNDLDFPWPIPLLKEGDFKIIEPDPDSERSKMLEDGFIT